MVAISRSNASLTSFPTLNRWIGTIDSRMSPAVRHFVRGKPRALVLDGVVIDAALAAEGVSHDELLAGLRRLGFEQPTEVRLAVLEETGHISAVAMNDKGGEITR